MLTSKQRRFLKGKAHPLKPVVLLGQHGLTDAIVKETDRALADHELIKVRLGDLAGPDEKESDARKAAAETIAKRTGADVVGLVGKLVILFRADPDEPRFKLPD